MRRLTAWLPRPLLSRCLATRLTTSVPTSLRRIWTSLGIPSDYPLRRSLPLQQEAKRLVSIGRAVDDGKNLRVTPGTATAWRRMHAAALADGVTLLPVSAFRSVAQQARIIRSKLATGESLASILRLVAAPGCSEHHTGRAIDVASPAELRLDTAFARTREYRWLRRHASRFGFVLSYPRRNPHGIAFEPWHWCYRGRAVQAPRRAGASRGGFNCRQILVHGTPPLGRDFAGGTTPDLLMQPIQRRRVR
jgi:zinc D-Ala-D-Ala carboxypeptidase